MAVNDLKPCPFCGGEAYVKTWWGGGTIGRYVNRVQCKKCRCNSGDWMQKPKAIEAWNRRVEDKE